MTLMSWRAIHLAELNGVSNASRAGRGRPTTRADIVRGRATDRCSRAARTRLDSDREVEPLAARRVEKVKRRKSVNRELRQRWASWRGTGAVLATGEALARRAYTLRVAPCTAPRASRIVRREGNNLREMCGKREAAGRDAAEENLRGEGGVDLLCTVVKDGDCSEGGSRGDEDSEEGGSLSKHGGNDEVLWRNTG